jgi:DNA-binding beta-propeller fold protein YncE
LLLREELFLLQCWRHLLQSHNVGNAPHYIAFDDDNNCWITNYGDSTVTKLSSLGITLGTYSTGGPNGITIDGSKNIWVANGRGGSVTKLSDTGSILGTFTVGGKPSKIAFDDEDNGWVTNNGDNVIKLSPSGSILGTYTTGTYTWGVVVDACNNVWVANNANNGGNTVVKLDSSNGNILETVNVGDSPFDLAIDPSGNIWVTYNSGTTVYKISSSGSVIGTFTAGNAPFGITTDGEGNIWVTNYWGNNVMKLDNNGNILDTITVGVAIDQSGNIWVANSGGSTVTKITVTTSAPTIKTPTAPTTSASTTNPSLPNCSPSKNLTGPSTGAPTQSTSTLAIGLTVSIVFCGAFGIFIWRRRSRPSMPQDKGQALPMDGGAIVGSKQKHVTNKKFIAFVSHHKTNSASNLAITIKKSLESKSRKVFVDQEATHLDILQLLVHLEESKTVILLLTKEMLHRPYCLLELNHAIVHKIPIITVRIEGEGYDFQESSEFLTYLDTKLDQRALNLIRTHNVDIIDIAYNLSNVIPNIIAKSFNFKEAKAIRAAQIEEISKAVQTAQFNEIPKSREEWLIARATSGTSSTTSMDGVMFAIEVTDDNTVGVVISPPSGKIEVDSAVELWRNRVKQLERFYSINDTKMAGESKVSLREFTLSMFEDFSFADIVKQVGKRYPDCLFPKSWLDDLANKNELGMMPDWILNQIWKDQV